MNLHEENVRPPNRYVTFFDWNNFSQMLHVSIYESLTSFWNKFFLLSSPSALEVSYMYSWFQATLKHLIEIKI